jgi:hypothetical protein
LEKEKREKTQITITVKKIRDYTIEPAYIKK